MVDDVGNDGVGQRSRDQDAVSGTAMDVRDDEAARVAQRRHAAPVRIVVADADGRMRFKTLRRIVDQTVQNDMVDFVAACVQETDDLATAGRMARHVADLDVRDVVVVRRKRAGDHRASVNARFPASVADGRQRDQIIARVSRNRLDDNVMAALPQVDAVLVQHRHRLAVDDFFRRRFEMQMGEQTVCAMFERHRPAVRIDDGDALNGKSIDIRHEHADVPPITRLRLALFSRVCTVSPVAKLLCAVAGRPRIVRAKQHGVADADDVDVVDFLDVLNAVAAIGRTDEIVAAAVRQLDGAVFDDERRIRVQQNRFVDQPEGAAVRVFASRHPQRAAALLFQN